MQLHNMQCEKAMHKERIYIPATTHLPPSVVSASTGQAMYVYTIN